MLRSFLLPETEVCESGAGSAFAVHTSAGATPQLTITLGITHILQQHSLEVAILGSEDGYTWRYPALASFSQKFYCGNYHLTLDLSQHPNVRYLLPRWKLSRWGRSAEQPLFGLYLLVEPALGEPAHEEVYALGAA